jgi:hypothetical protein
MFHKWTKRAVPLAGLLLCTAVLTAEDKRKPVVAERPSATSAADAAGNASVRTGKKVMPEGELRFDQDKAQAHMRELEERMFRLADLLRQAQPDDSARLLIGVRRSRDQLIVQQMQEAAALLDKLDLSTAGKEQKEILAKLEELKRLLLTADLDLELKLEQLRRLRDAREKLERLIAREEQQKTQTDGLAKKPPQNPQVAMDSLKGSEQANRRMSEDLEQIARRMGPSAAGAAGALGGAGKCMGGACNSLSQSKPGEASKEQKQALDQLAQAKQEMERLEEKLRKEVESLARQRVMEHLTKMLAQQKQVREATEKLLPRLADKQPQAVVAVRQLAGPEEAISGMCAECIELVETTQFSVVLPTALTAVNEQIDSVSERLREGRADKELVVDEKRIESDLQALLEAMKDASNSSNKNGGGQCKGCKGDRNKLLAEVKMLRWMQSGVHTDTAKLDERKTKQSVNEADLSRAAAELSRRQDSLRLISDRLHSMTCPHCLAGDE